MLNEAQLTSRHKGDQLRILSGKAGLLGGESSCSRIYVRSSVNSFWGAHSFGDHCKDDGDGSHRREYGSVRAAQIGTFGKQERTQPRGNNRELVCRSLNCPEMSLTKEVGPNREEDYDDQPARSPEQHSEAPKLPITRHRWNSGQANGVEYQRQACQCRVLPASCQPAAQELSGQ